MRAFPPMIVWLLLACSAWNAGTVAAVPEKSDAQRLEFFENHIRPALIKYCLDCHSTESEISGGLSLDARSTWEAGGDSGIAISPGNPEESRLFSAIQYNDPALKMPPDGRLPADVIAAFSKWISDGAYDPRNSDTSHAKPQTGLPVEQAHEHWAYRPLTNVTLPPDLSTTIRSPIDYFLNRRLREEGLEAAPSIDRSGLVRRLHFDLTGLPPIPTKTDPRQSTTAPAGGQPFGADDEAVLDQLINRLLESPQYGEHFARKWMDVARYAESITLRGFVLPEAWRYRDYLVEAFAADRPFDQMIREQVAGDLLDSGHISERRMQLTATAFLAMGNTNLEQQDKSQLEMDFIDEQLEVIGRAFLGQTIGCARCHDHKFDPIPTKDYYAMAGTLRSAVALKHDNVSKWIEQPLPLPEAERLQYADFSNRLAAVEERLSALKKKKNSLTNQYSKSVMAEELAGIVIDNDAATLVGAWSPSDFKGLFVGDGYIHDEDSDKGKKTVTFEPASLPPGHYEVRLSYTANGNRASNTSVRVFSADGEKVMLINQRIEPPEDGIWISLGEFRFEQDGQAYVLISNENSNGTVIADAVQFLPLPLGRPPGTPREKTNQGANDKQSSELDAEKIAAELDSKIRSFEQEKEDLQNQLAQQPRYLTVIEQRTPADIPVHIRGDVHNLGEMVPRGFLTAVAPARDISIPHDASGRLELATWLSSDRNPLTARVYANRIWCWLMGQGIVPTVNNFGTTGAPPTHPELLEWLANELIRSGWSTKHLIRTIVRSDAYRRRIIEPDKTHSQIDPANRLYWRGHLRRLPAEGLRDAMLVVSGELDQTVGGSLIRAGTKADYDYQHASTRRSIYQPVFRNSLPELFEPFDFADTSVSTGQRPRSTVATQALVLLNNKWVAERAKAAANHFLSTYNTHDPGQLVIDLYEHCFYRQPSESELQSCVTYLSQSSNDEETARLELLIQSLFASLDFRYLE